MKKRLKQSIFITQTIRELTSQESYFRKEVSSILNLEMDQCTVSYIPKIFSKDNLSRPLILRKETVLKIEKKHGKININNLLINAHNWDMAVKNVDAVPEKICLIKQIPHSDNILIIGAFRENGFFVLSHYEVQIVQDNQLKSLLGRGDYFRRGA
jgi:hypothetical protein